MWDLRKIYTVYKKEPIAKCQLNYGGNIANNGFSSLAICPARITLFASCMDNNIYAYNISSYNPKPGKYSLLSFCYYSYNIWILYFIQVYEAYFLNNIMKIFL